MALKPYRPPQKILEKYADVMVNFALGSGKGIKHGDVVRLTVGEVAKPLFIEIRKAIWKAGGHVVSNYHPTNDEEFNVEKDFYLYAEEHQLDFFPKNFMKGMVDDIDHSLFIISKTDPHSLKGVDPKKIMRSGKALRPIHDWQVEKENQGKFTWTGALYGTEGLAKEAGLSLKDYWGQIIKACYLNEKDPVAKWREVGKKLDQYRKKLDALPADRFHIEGPDADLWIKLGDKRKWVGGGGKNIPSFELFTSPDWRGTEGWMRFDQPLYVYGTLVKGIELWFKGGKVIKSKATKGEKVLKEMIATEGADKVGEFSMTDRRFSNITKFMAHTLYDENVGGKNGNTHIALGNAYQECFEGDRSKVDKKTWEALGYNISSVHTDIISTAPRTVTAYLKNGKTKVIYKNGEYCL